MKGQPAPDAFDDAFDDDDDTPSRDTFDDAAEHDAHLLTQSIGDVGIH